MTPTQRQEAAAAIAQAKTIMRMDVTLMGDLGDQLEQWNRWCDVFVAKFGTRWILISWEIQIWLLSDSKLADQILTEPESRLQFRFIGRRNDNAVTIKAELIGCETFDSVG